MATKKPRTPKPPADPSKPKKTIHRRTPEERLALGLQIVRDLRDATHKEALKIQRKIDELISEREKCWIVLEECEKTLGKHESPEAVATAGMDP